jgi:ATPase subunit of ABC transporter with duplicated ATPase domains
MEKLNRRAVDLDVNLLDKKIDQMMPELGFKAVDNERKVRSFSGGWQMRMCLGKMLLQEPDVLLLDEPTNHLDLDAIQWLEGYLKQQEVGLGFRDQVLGVRGACCCGGCCDDEAAGGGEGC